MVSVQDVAAYIVERKAPITAMKLQKLVYYCQAWSLVWDEQPLFDAEIQAWANGPVVYELYKKHRGQFTVAAWPWGDPAALNATQRETVDAVLSFYGDYTAHQLSVLTHAERPWVDAREGVPEGERSDATISPTALYEYYDSLTGV